MLAKLERFDWEVQQRMALGARYSQLCQSANIMHIPLRAGNTSVYAQYTVRVPQHGQTREQVQAALKAASIPTAVHYPIPLNQQTAYRHLCQRPTPIAAQLAQEVMSLPMSPDLTHAQQDEVVHEVALAIQNNA